MKFLFIIQTEGRGHISQALTLADMLEEAQHEVVKVLVGKSPRPIPEYLLKRFADRYTLFDSPSFTIHTSGKGLSIIHTVFKNIICTPNYIRSILKIRAEIRVHRPDVVINFYDPLGTTAQWGWARKHKVIVISHHFYLTSAFHTLIPNRPVETLLLRMLNSWLRLGCDAVWVPSLRKEVGAKNLKIVPPLLRKELLVAKTQSQNYILAYSVNPGYAQEIKAWQAKHPEVVLHYFWDGPQEHDQVEVQSNLFFHRLDQAKFAKYLTRCKAYVTTAGFESVCEALFLGKPVLLVPVSQHIEQANNAADARRTGQCMVAQSFDLDSFLDFSKGDFDNTEFRDWVQQASIRYLDALDSV